MDGTNNHTFQVHLDHSHHYEMEQNHYMTPPLSTGPSHLPYYEQAMEPRACLPPFKPAPIDPESYTNPLRISRDGVHRDNIIEDLMYNRSASAHVTPHGTPNLRAERSSSVPGQPWQPIAPWPPTNNWLLGKRRRADTDLDSVNQDGTPKRRRADLCASPTELNDEERLLLQLKEDQNLPWKDIAVEFKAHFGRVFQVPALQMRFKRLRERLRRWTDVEVLALRQAVDYYDRCKWEIVAEKMLDFECEEKWAAKLCEKKWGELHHYHHQNQNQHQHQHQQRQRQQQFQPQQLGGPGLLPMSMTPTPIQTPNLSHLQVHGQNQNQSQNQSQSLSQSQNLGMYGLAPPPPPHANEHSYMPQDLGLRSPRASIQDSDGSFASAHPSPRSRGSPAPAPPSVSHVPGLTPSL